MNRSAWHARTSAVVLAWLAAAAIVALAHRQVPASTWLMVHLLMLGAVTSALVHVELALHGRGAAGPASQVPPG